jgi:nucleotide-binding universal stress UspA family protein
MTTLIVATDGSEMAIGAALAGLALAKPADRLLVVSAVESIDPSDDATGHAGPTLTQKEADALRRDAEAEGYAAVTATEEALRNAGCTDRQIEGRLIEGEPGPALCRLAADVDAAALILGSRGRGGLKRALLGSVSDYVVRNAPCSVIVSKEAEPG